MDQPSFPVNEKGFSVQSALKKMVQLFLAIVFGFLLVMILLLYGCQRKLMYHPQPYRHEIPRELKDWTVETITFPSENPDQEAYFMRQKNFSGEESAPKKLWVCFHGNASLALDYAHVYFENMESEQDVAFLLIEYPGYGNSAGSPTRKNIIRNSELAYATLLSDRAWKPEDSALGVVGFSMGAAVGLEFAAAQYNVREVILFAPFTTILEMANLVVPFPLNYIAIDRFNNTERLKQLIQSNRTNVTIYHGEADQVIPISMGRELANMHPDFKFNSKPNVDHNTVIDAFIAEFTAQLMD
ncbi:MAG: alpha/beta hydrolase [Sumerlaeia bacterium]